MTEEYRIPAESLYRYCDISQMSFRDTSELPELQGIIGQQRAAEALAFGAGIQREGYNLFVIAPQGLGQKNIVLEYLQKRVAESPPPYDWCYINNFTDPNKPHYLKLPAGTGVRLQNQMKQLVEDLMSAIPRAFESSEYQAHANEIEQEFDERQEQAFRTLRQHAEENNISLIHTPGGFAFTPMREGNVISPEEYEKLPDEEKQRIESVVKKLQEELRDILQNIPRWQKESAEKLRKLNQDTVSLTVNLYINDLKHQYPEQTAVLEYLDEVQADVIEHSSDFRRDDSTPEFFLGQLPPKEQRFRRYEVNVLIDNSQAKVSPIFYEDNPAHDTIVGRVEHLAHMGALVTDFMLIRPGALHRANGGYLILDARKVLTQPYAWDALKRILYSKEIRIESLGQMLSLISTVSLEPEPIPLDVKVVLLGDQFLYYLLCELDPEFEELFKVAVDFNERIDRSEENNLLYAQFIGTLVRREKLRPFSHEAVARLIEHSSREVGDAEKLSAHSGRLKTILYETDYWAEQAGHEVATREDVQKAIDKKIHRIDRLRTEIQEETLRGTILIATDGERVGQINGLSVHQLGDFSFGRPSRITATTRLGKGEVVDIEREVELGGPFHSKGVLILTSYLKSNYCQDHPLSLMGSIVFEQSYGLIDGDSASMAELCALLSSLSAVPIRQSIAITGSVNQYGEMQAIGGVNQKIEGFFDICQARGLTGKQGVLIPYANLKHLMLREDVISAVKQNRFHIFAAKNVNEALEVLTGVPAGVREAQGKYPDGSINAKVESRLLYYAARSLQFSKIEDMEKSLQTEVEKTGESDAQG